MYLEISDSMTTAEKHRKEAIISSWKAAGAGVDTQEDPLLPDELGIHAIGCLGQADYRHDAEGH